MTKIDPTGKVNTPNTQSPSSGSGVGLSAQVKPKSNSGVFSLPSLNKLIDDIYGPVATQSNRDVTTCDSAKGALETILLPKEYRRFTLEDKSKVPKEIERAVLRSFGLSDHTDFPTSLRSGLEDFARIREIKVKIADLNLESPRRNEAQTQRELDELYKELNNLDRKIAGDNYDSLFRQKLYTTCLKDVFLGSVHKIVFKSSLTTDKKSLLDSKLKGFLAGLLSKRVTTEGFSKRTSKLYTLSKSYYDDIKTSESYPDGLGEALNICFKNQCNYLLSFLLENQDIPENIADWFERIDGGNPDSVKEFAEVVNEVNDFYRIYTQIESVGGTRDCILIEGIERLAVKLQTGDFTKESTSGTVLEQLIAHGINDAIDYYQKVLQLHFQTSGSSDTTTNRSSQTPTDSHTTPRLDPGDFTPTPSKNGSHPKTSPKPEVDTSTQPPDFSFIAEENTPAVIAARKNGSHKKGKTATPAQTNFNTRRTMVLGGGAALGFMGLGFAGWAAGLFGGNKPENNTNTTTNGNGGTPKVNGTNTQSSGTDQKKTELIAEIVKLKAEFSTYTEAEDKQQVTTAYLNHGLNVTMASETQLKALSEEALRDIYVESLDVSCRVQAKKELEEIDIRFTQAEIKEQILDSYEIDINPDKRVQKLINLFKPLYLKLAVKPTEDFIIELSRTQLNLKTNNINEIISYLQGLNINDISAKSIFTIINFEPDYNPRNQIMSQEEWYLDDASKERIAIYSFLGFLKNSYNNNSIIITFLSCDISGTNYSLPQPYFRTTTQNHILSTANLLKLRLNEEAQRCKDNLKANTTEENVNHLRNAYDLLSRINIMKKLIEIRIKQIKILSP